MSYKVITDPSGALLEDISGIIYTNYDVSYIPAYSHTYQLRNSVGKIVANNMDPFSSPTSFGTQLPYLAHDATNNVYVTKQNNAFNSNTVAKIVNNQLVDLNFTLGYTSELYINGIAFDSSGGLYITTSNHGDAGLYSSRIFRVAINSIKSIVTSVSLSNMDLNNKDLRGLDFDSSGNLYTADNANSNILKISNITYSSDLGFVGVGSIYVPNYVGLNGPLDIKFDQYNNGYIANSRENNIIKITSAGVISIFATGLLYPTELTFSFTDSVLYSTNYGTSQGDINQTYIAEIVNGIITKIKYVEFPYGVVATTTGAIYYTSATSHWSYQGADEDTNKIYKLTQNNITSNYANTIPYPDIPGTQSISPITSTAFDASNNLYAAQYTNDLSYNGYFGVIWKIPGTDPSYNPIRFYPTSSIDPSLNNPTSLAFNIAKTYLYVANSSSNQIIAIPMNGSTRTKVDISGVLLSLPSAIVFDGSGNLYVANSLNNTICILTFSNPTTATSVLYDISGSPLFSPAGLDFDSTYRNLYVSNAGYNNILKIPLSTNVASIYNLNGVPINSPSGLILDNSNNILYVSDLDTSKIIQITNNNTASNLSIIAGNSRRRPIQPITLNQPMGLTMDTSGNLYISNYANYYDAVVKLTFDYSYNEINSTGLFFPTDTAIGIINRNIFVSNSQNNIISKLDADNVLTNYATTPNTSIRNVSLTINDASGVLYVLDNSANVYSINSSAVATQFIISGTIGNRPSSGAQCIRYRQDSSSNLLYIANTPTNQIIKVNITNPLNAGSGTAFDISGIPQPFKLTRIAFDSSGSMYISAGDNTNASYNSKIVYKITNLNTSPLVATSYITFPDISGNTGIPGIAFDSEDYMYTLAVTDTYVLYRTSPDGSPPELIPQYFNTVQGLTSLNYAPWENSLVMTDTDNNRLYKVYLSYTFTNMYRKLGLYDDTLFIFGYFDNQEGLGYLFDVSFNVYTPYLVINPRGNIAPNDEVSFHFVNPYVIPDPTDSYILRCNGTSVSDIFCNNCTYNKSKFLAGTYPTGLVYSTATTYLYVALKNNTITRISALGIVDNEYFPPELGLIGPTSLVLDNFSDMFVLNAGSDFISFITLRNNIISVDNTFFTGIYVPICLTYDPDTDSLYLLSGAVPNTRITRINARTGAVIRILPIPFGVLYDPNGLSIDAYYGLVGSVNYVYSSNIKYLYVSNTDQNNNNEIKRIDLTTTDLSGNLIYEITPLVSNLLYKPFTMANQNDGYLYVANKTSNNISKISITGLEPNEEAWAVNGISVPADLCFDNLGDLFIANSGTSPRNSRVSKIYTNYFFFPNVKLTNGRCDSAEIWDTTTQSYVYIGYYPSDPYIFPIPVPYPIGS